MAAQLLYIHPSGHLNDLVVPAGAVSCLNAIEGTSKLGRYAFEVTDQEIRSARIVAIDLHWAVGIAGFTRLVRHVRQVNPRTVLVAGGITAGHFSADILRTTGIDYVVHGDSEVPFKNLIESILENRTPVSIPGVSTVDGIESSRDRMTCQEFDATDCLTVDWFPTYETVTDWRTASFSQGRTIPVLRGCPCRCPACYGSAASVFGEGFLMRSPEGFVRELKKAEQLGVRKLHIILGKPSSEILTGYCRALAEEGPFRLGPQLDLYLCRAPERADLEALEQAFEGRFSLSMIPPEDHVPALPPVKLEEERDLWMHVARQVSRSREMLLEMWPSTPAQMHDLRNSTAQLSGSRVSVSLAVPWQVTRPGTGTSGNIQKIRDLAEAVPSFYLMKLLSPTLARLLRPFGLLDKMERDPRELWDPNRIESQRFQALMQNWERHRLPVVPGIRFAMVGLRMSPGATLGRSGFQVHYEGNMGLAHPGSFEVVSRAATPVLTWKNDHDAVRMKCSLHPGEPVDAYAFVPLPPGTDETDAEWIDRLQTSGLTAMTVGTSPPGTTVRILHVTYRVQEVFIGLLDEDQNVLERGHAHLGYFHPPLKAQSRRKPAS